MLSVKQGSIKYHFLSLWYGSTWDWTQISGPIWWTLLIRSMAWLKYIYSIDNIILLEFYMLHSGKWDILPPSPLNKLDIPLYLLTAVGYSSTLPLNQLGYSFTQILLLQINPCVVCTIFCILKLKQKTVITQYSFFRNLAQPMGSQDRQLQVV